ncbi:thioredoxin-disulfide reductase [Pseudobutyrivibrio ruminis]|uniref:Thioredoxin reductase n=1 Tax=Pseudobutyrivibrio ruminis DSM 9787 TaxID=1123011 RepID=A0A285T1M3_9FIRM|nr:thioredoxin-disulfide reductase [Pseudobutyrivibrio ruminis]SOC15113.1 thioredoxin reductase (NADPH) [Pseudobutyrivibrio ruminis DSM 9787]
MVYDVIVIGAGPAGLAAGIYGKRAGYNILVLDTSSISGGQILNTYEVDNYPGIPGVSGTELAEAMKKHCEKLGVEFARGRVTSIVDNGQTKELVTKKENFQTKTVIIATGATNRKLGCPGEDEFSGMGVSYCATCDGAFFKDKVVAVVGGGDVALEDAAYLARTCKKVYLIHRRDEFRGAVVLQNQIKSLDNVELVLDSTVESIIGNDSVEKLLIKNKKTNEERELEVDGVFIAVGTVPNTKTISGLPSLDERGYIVADETCETNIPGVFAAGDVRTKQLRQVITATADGANAITSITNYLNLK